MKRTLLAVALLLGLAATSAQANSLEGRTGIGGQLGLQKLVGGDYDYSNVDQNLGVWLRHGFSPRWSLELGGNYGWNRPAVLAGEDAGLEFGSVHAFYTTQLTGFAGLRYHFAPDRRFGPYVGLRAGVMNWQVRDENGTDFGHLPGGPTATGYDTDGALVELEGTKLVGTLSLGVEYFLSSRLSLDLGASYTLIAGNDVDNVGSSVIWGPGQVDANTGRLDAFVGGTLYFGGSRDADQDGYEDKYDACPDEAEDFDGFRDTDGCPDPDNDNDGLLDGEDACPDDAEDLDGYRDEDGCPDPDNDGDGVIDAKDTCPDEAEDLDGFQDDDGCPDPDNDGDGVLDAADKCPDTAPGVRVDLTGCPIAAIIKAAMVLQDVTFEHNSSVLGKDSYAILDQVAESLAAYPEVKVEIQGHTDSTGSAAYNLDMSSRRATAVRGYLVSKGISPERMTAVGYGEDLPIADNTTREGQATNRRVELVRIN